MKGRIPLWIDLRHVPVNKRLPYLHAIDEVAAERVLLAKEDPHLLRDGIEPVIVDGKNALKHRGQPAGRIMAVHDSRSQEKAAAADGLVVIDAEDWRVIPLENLIAARRGKPGTLYALARGPKDAALFADTLETGVHGIVLAPRATSDVYETDRLLRERHRPPKPSRPLTVAEAAATAAAGVGPSSNPGAGAADTTSAPSSGMTSAGPVAEAGSAGRAFLETATVTSVTDGGVGDRVCVDTTSIFRDGEGLLVGSTSRSFVLVHAETVETEFVRARPFRVNAGAVHMYLYAPEGKTRYLSELRSGDPVLAIHADGIHRVLTIGRCKVERRPHFLVRWASRGVEASAVLQNAETIRLVRPDGSRVAVTDLKPGDEVLVHNEEAARHFGMPVDAGAEER